MHVAFMPLAWMQVVSRNYAGKRIDMRQGATGTWLRRADGNLRKSFDYPITPDILIARWQITVLAHN